MKLNAAADKAVKDFTADIIVSAKEFNKNIDISIDYHEVHNTDITLYAHKITLTSSFGKVIVFPDFAKNNTKAAILHLGELNRLRKEGFDEEFIHTQGVIYGSLVDYNKTHIKMLGCYLTHKINN